MDTIQKGILMLIKSAITGEAQPVPAGFVLMDAAAIIREHQLGTLIYTGAVHCGFSAADPVIRGLLRDVTGLMILGERQRRAVGRVCSAFAEQNIDFMPLKGTLMQKRYPNPDLRRMGDADILIRVEQYEMICPILKELGFEEIQTSDHELIWKSPDLLLELHKRLIPTYNRDYYAYFGDGWRLATIKKGTRYGMSQEDEYIYLFTHFAKHYRDGGIGCRHVLDLWVMRRCMKEPDMDYVRTELKKLSLDQFHENMERVISNWFEDGPEDAVTELITQYIFSSGSWGLLKNHVLAADLRQYCNHKKKGKDYLRVLFPEREAMQYAYPIVIKAPWMIPLVWIWRWIATLLFRRKRIQQRITRLNMSDEQAVDDYQRALDAVGLRFKFQENV